MEPNIGCRNKKLIWALESYELLGRPTCSECNDQLRKKRGCFKPGYAIKGDTAWRFTSPRLQSEDNKPVPGLNLLEECPTGAILREAPYIYDAIAAHNGLESGAFDPTLKPRYLQECLRVIGAEKSRLWEMKQSQEKSATDAKYARRVLASNG